MPTEFVNSTLESSANPQPGKAALRGARFPARGFWRLSSRQIATLSSNPRASRAWKGAVTPVSSAQNGGKTHISEVVRTHRSSRALLGRCGAALDCGDMSPLFLHRTQAESRSEFKRSRGQLVL